MKRITKVFLLKDLPNKIVAKEGVHKTYYFFHTGSIKNKSIDIVLTSKNSEVELNGAILGGKNDNIDLYTTTTHKVGSNNSRVNINTVLKDNCVFNYTGMINIDTKARFSDAYLQQDNLVVDDTVICNTSPQLQIKNDDVKASHGATVGSFNINQLFYLTSRGLNESVAKKIICEGFLSSVYKDDLQIVLKYLNKNSLV